MSLEFYLAHVYSKSLHHQCCLGNVQLFGCCGEAFHI